MSTKHALSREIAHEPVEPNALDGFDSRILAILSNKARASNDQIAHEVGLSPSAVSRRIRALENRGIITGYRAAINDSVLGKTMTVFVRVTLERQSAAALHAFELGIAKCDAVLSCHLMAGDYDYMLLVRVANMADYERVHQKHLSRLPAVLRIESNFAVREVKDH